MNNSNQSSRGEDETTVLHLNKFAPGQASPEPSVDEGQTVFIKRAAAETADQSPEPVIAPKTGNQLPARELLGAIVYCYSKGVFRSEEIERFMVQNEELRASLNGEVPDANVIRRFRRLNRRAIQTTLEKHYRRERQRQKAAAAAIVKEVMPGALPPEKSPIRAASPTSAPGEDTAIFVRREATDQLDKATFIDGMLRGD